MSVGQLPLGAWSCSCGAWSGHRALYCTNCGKPRHPKIDWTKFEPCDDEGKLHEDIIKKLKAFGWPYVHSRMDKPTTCQWGVPDFIIAAPNGLTLWIEAKALTRKVTPEQEGMGLALCRNAHKWYVVRSMDEFNAVLEKNSL